MPNPIFTVGHSHHTPERFLELLRASDIDAVADVRSQPYSRFNPDFNQRVLRAWLSEAGLQYVSLGGELGARSSEKSCYENGKVVYDRLAAQPDFKRGLDRLIQGAATYRITLLCAEKEPLDCHRTILVSRELITRGANVVHILSDGALETHSQTMARLLDNFGLTAPHMFRTPEQTLALAYQQQEEKIAYQEPETADPVLVA